MKTFMLARRSLRLALTLNGDATIELADENGTGKVTFAVQHVGEHIVLASRVADHDLRIELSRADLTQEPLVARGFHWIQEDPYNR